MFFRQIATTEATLSYFFGCATAGKAVAVDVVAGEPRGENAGPQRDAKVRVHLLARREPRDLREQPRHQRRSRRAVGAAWSARTRWCVPGCDSPAAWA